MTFKFKDANEFIPDEFLDAFGREFCKQEVLWKTQPNSNEFQIQPGTHVAYRTLAKALNLSVEAVLELLKTFPAICLDLMSRYEMCRWKDAGCRWPDWLRPLAQHFRLLNNSIKASSLEHDTSAAIVNRDLARALCDSARAGLGAVATGSRASRSSTSVAESGTEDEASPLLDPRAVARFVERHHSSERRVLPAWRSLVKLCVVKLYASAAAGDRAEVMPGSLQSSAAESAVCDLALLHHRRVSQITCLTPAKLRMLVLLFRLIVAAKEIYDREERRRRDRERDADGGLNPDERDPRSEKGADPATPAMGLYDDPPEVADSARIPDTLSVSNKLNSTVEELSTKCIEPRNTHNLLRERVIECESRRKTNDLGDTTVEESSENELHTELDLEPDINIVSSDTSDYYASDKYLKESSENNIEVPILLDKNQVKKLGSDIIEKSDNGYKQNESDISSKSQNSDSRTQYPTKYWYEESKSNSSEVQRVVWALVYTDFIKRGRSASLISLQHRWVELLHRARFALLTAWSSDMHTHRNVHPLLLVVAYWFPEIVTESLPTWKKLVLERQIVLESDIKDIIDKYQENDEVLLNITENITYPDLLQQYVNNEDVNYPQSHSKNNSTNKHLSYQIHKDNSSRFIDEIDKVLEGESQAQESSINNELNVNNSISRMLDRIDPSKAKVSIIFDEDSDEDVRDDTSMDVTETTSHLNNLHVLKSEEAASRSRVHQIPCALEKCNKLTDITMENIEQELEDKLHYMNNSRSDVFVRNNDRELNKSNNANNDLHEDEQIVNYDLGSQDELSLLEPKSPVIDEKLINLSRVVVTPIEHLPEWKKHSRNGVIKCRSFSVKNFTKPVLANSIQLSKCTPYININKVTFDREYNYNKRSENGNEEYKSENYMKNEIRIKFEDEDDINNGIIYQKYIELYAMPERCRKNRIKLTRRLKLSRTYFSLNFWSLDRNIELMKLCKPMAINVNKSVPRVAKPVQLPDIDEVRRINRTILTAQVSPTLDTTPLHTQTSSASQEAVNATNNSISSTTRQTNNSISSAMDSSELIKLLTDYAKKTNIPKNCAIESVTKDITSNSNLMDTIVETMRLADKNNIQNSTITCTLNSLQPTDSTEMSTVSCNTNISTSISATDPFSTIQKCTEEPRNIPQLNSINNSLTPTKIHISSDCTKELYVKHVQKMNNDNNREETRTPNLRDLKDMILLLVKRFDNKMRHKYMKLDRSGLNFHLKKYEKQQLALIKDIYKLTKILPQYTVSEQNRSLTENATVTNRPNKNNCNKWKQSKQHAAYPSGGTDNIIDLDINTNSVFDDDDCETNLVIDEGTLELTDNIELNNSQCNTININKNTQETCNLRKKDKKIKRIKKVKKKSKHSKKISEEEKPMLNEYQEWQRQKTMALKYFTIPMSDTNKLTSKDKIAYRQSATTSSEQQSNACQTNISIKRNKPEKFATTSTEQQSKSCQTNIPMKRKNTENLATTTKQPPTASNTTKRPKMHPYESDVVCISDTSSDDDVQITECSFAKDTATVNTNKDNPDAPQPDIRQIDKTENGNKIFIFNDTAQMKPNQNVCVINTPVAAITQPVYLIINDTQMPTATPNAINKTQDAETINNPLLFQVLSNATFPTLTKIVSQTQTEQSQAVVNNEITKRLVQRSDTLQCQKAFNNNCKCIKCDSTVADDVLTCNLNAIHNLTSQDSTNNMPSNSLLKKNNRPIKEAITVKEYLSSNKKLTALIKVDGSQKLVFFCNRYIILTDVNIPSNNSTYRTTIKTKKYKALSEVLVPNDSRGSVLLLGPKKESDYIYCKCVKGAGVSCNLCNLINIHLPKPTNFLKINSDYYKKMCEKPIKYVRLNEKELVSNSRIVLEGNPDLILFSSMFFKKLTDTPPTYVRILSSLPDIATLQHLIRKEVTLYAFDVTQTQHYHTPLTYAQTAGHITVDHSDDKLVKVLQWILN